MKILHYLLIFVIILFLTTVLNAETKNQNVNDKETIKTSDKSTSYADKKFSNRSRYVGASYLTVSNSMDTPNIDEFFGIGIEGGILHRNDIFFGAKAYYYWESSISPNGKQSDLIICEFNLLVTYFPISNLFLRFGFGFASLSFYTEDPDYIKKYNNNSIDESGISVVTGTGWSFKSSSNDSSVTVGIDLSYQKYINPEYVDHNYSVITYISLYYFI
ncbi:MAG: hypothetical protein V1874_16130 [Spirochaetota bacterium]